MRSIFKTVSNIKQSIPIHYQVAAAAWISRIISAISQLIIIPIALSYLGINQYAIFAILVWLQMWFILADCGLGSSLQNAISEANAKNQDIHCLIVNATGLMIILFVIVYSLFFLAAPFLQYWLFHNLNSSFAYHHKNLLRIVSLIMISTTFFGISYRILLARHQGYWAYLYQSIAYSLSIVSILFIKHFYPSTDRNALLILSIGFLVPQSLLAAVAYLKTNFWKNFFNYLDITIMKQLLSKSFGFWWYSIIVFLTLYTDYFVASQTLNNVEITIYNVISKGFNFAYCFYFAVLNALWPELSELFHRQQPKRAEAILHHNLKLGLGMVILFTLFFILGRKLISIILLDKTDIILSINIIILFGIYTVFRLWTDTYSVALVSQNSLKGLSGLVSIQALISIGSMYMLSLHFGLQGILLGLIFSSLCTTAWMYPLVYYKRNNQLER